MLDDIEPTPTRGVIAIGRTCTQCGRPDPILGKPGKGRPLDTFEAGYFCTGHAVRTLSFESLGAW